MQREIEPSTKQGSCSYCGNAAVNHLHYFLESAVFITIDNHARKFLKYIPNFIKKFADSVPEFLFRTLSFFKLAKFSDDIDKANSFRSKIIWEEAKKRGIKMEQVIFMGKPLDQYRAMLKIKDKNKYFYFESIPTRPEFSDMRENWDDKAILKRELIKNNIPVPSYFELSFLNSTKKNIEKIFSKLTKPVIVKPRVGSRGRHTITNIHDLRQLKSGIEVASEICSHLIVEEHLHGSVCRATLVDGELAGFYSANASTLVGDGKKTIQQLVQEADNSRENRVEPIRITKELHEHIARSGFVMDSVLPLGAELPLTHRMGRLFGGKTKEMLDDLHPSFIPILKRAASVTGLPVVGFDCIIPDATRDEATQKWGIIECNTLPFIDLHYFALEGKPRNIAGMIWDMW